MAQRDRTISYREYRRQRKKLLRVRLAVLCCIPFVVAAAGAVAVKVFWPSDRILAEAASLGHVRLAGIGERVQSTWAVDASGRQFAVRVRAGALYPVGKVPAGDRLTVNMTVRRAGWVGWLVGKTVKVSSTVAVPRAAHATVTILRPRAGGEVTVRFDHPVSVVSFKRPGADRQQLVFPHPRWTVPIGVHAAGKNRFGTVVVAAATRSWEQLPRPARLSWFPAGARLEALVSPNPGTTIQPKSAITISFSEPIANILGSTHPALSPSTPGTWTQTAVNSLTFHPSGAGFGLGSHISLALPAVTDVTAGGHTRTLSSLTWSVPIGSTLRLEQLLAELGYLPLSWQAAGSPVANTTAAQEQAAIDAPKGTFAWRYPDTPSDLQGLWVAGEWTRMTQGAVMAFEHDQGLEVDGIPGPLVWHALIAAAMTTPTPTHQYSYVLVHRSVPQTLILWQDGQTILTTRINTGVPAAPTPFGTHAVFEHIPIGTMRGRNPDGSKYVDHGIRWISYFNGGEAIHGFNRATYGFPQSVGCVETSLSDAAKIWPYTPIGTLVSIVP